MSIDITQTTLEAAMRGASLRQTLLTDNIVNAETPGYQRQDVNFQATLAGALESGQALEGVAFAPEVLQGVAGPNGNGVNLDQEATLLAKNGLDYQALTQILGARDATMRAAMGAS